MDKIFEIEEKYVEANDLRINNVRIWPVYRIILRFLLINRPDKRQVATAPAPSTGATPFLRNTWRSLKHMLLIIKELPDIRKWVRSYDYIIFSNDLEQRQMNGMTIDKLATGLIEQLGEKRTLLINYPAGNVSGKRRNLKHKSFVNGQVINSLAALLQPGRMDLPEKDRLWVDKICSENNLSDNGLDQIGFFFRKARILDLFLKKWKPKLVFNCCYTYQVEVYAAKKRGIRTVELQHGIVSPLHPGYDSRLAIDKSFSAEFLLSFGENSTKNLSNNIVNLSKVIPVGNLYLEETFRSAPDPAIRDLVAQFEQSVCIPTDSMTEEAIMEFILPLAEKNPRIGYFVVPRLDMFERNVKKIDVVGNIRILTGQSFQNVVRHCTVQTGTVSTCCLEALSLGVPNILINTDGRAKEIYGDLMDDKYNFFVSEADDYFLSLEKLKGYSKEEVRNSNYKNFNNNYRENLPAAFKTIQC